MEKERVVIIGAAGQLGYDLARAFSISHDVFPLSREDAQIEDEKALFAAISKHAPTLVINAAAFHKLEECERNPAKSFLVNSTGALFASTAASLSGAKILYVSTDYVFDGDQAPFFETDLPHPLNVYGASKLSGEESTLRANSQSYIVRTSALFGAHEGSKGASFVRRMVALAREGKPLRVVSDQKTCPTYTRDLAEKIVELVEKKVPFGIYHITNQGSCSWQELAAFAVHAAGLSTPVEAISTDESGTTLRRPRNSVLGMAALPAEGIALLPPWQDAVTRYLKEIQAVS